MYPAVWKVVPWPSGQDSVRNKAQGTCGNAQPPLATAITVHNIQSSVPASKATSSANTREPPAVSLLSLAAGYNPNLLGVLDTVCESELSFQSCFLLSSWELMWWKGTEEGQVAKYYAGCQKGRKKGPREWGERALERELVAPKPTQCFPPAPGAHPAVILQPLQHCSPLAVLISINRPCRHLC